MKKIIMALVVSSVLAYMSGCAATPPIAPGVTTGPVTIIAAVLNPGYFQNNGLVTLNKVGNNNYDSWVIPNTGVTVTRVVQMPLHEQRGVQFGISYAVCDTLDPTGGTPCDPGFVGGGNPSPCDGAKIWLDVRARTNGFTRVTSNGSCFITNTYSGDPYSNRGNYRKATIGVNLETSLTPVN